MYDLVMEENEAGIIPEALQRAIELRGISPAQLSRDSGVSKGTISLILAGERPNTPARILARLAVALDVSVDYLVGVATNPEPRSLGVGALQVELARVARQLPRRRQRDLVAIAVAYLKIHESTPHNDQRLMVELQELVEEFGGLDHLRGLLHLLNSEDGFDRIDRGGEEPPDGNH